MVRKLACSEMKFDKEVMVIPNIIADGVLQKRKADIDADQRDWFCNFSSWWVRWFYTNDKHWRKELKKDDPRPFMETWIGHWADAFLKEGPDAFIAKMREASKDFLDPEWQPGGELA